MKDELTRASQAQRLARQFQIVGIDVALLLEKKSLDREGRVVESLRKEGSRGG